MSVGAGGLLSWPVSTLSALTALTTLTAAPLCCDITEPTERRCCRRAACPALRSRPCGKQRFGAPQYAALRHTRAAQRRTSPQYDTALHTAPPYHPAPGCNQGQRRGPPLPPPPPPLPLPPPPLPSRSPIPLHMSLRAARLVLQVQPDVLTFCDAP